jgi:hypothetical protein
MIIKSLLNKKGFSLPGVMIAMAIAGSTAIYIMKIMDNNNRSLRMVEMKSDVTEFKALLKTALQDRETCTKTFGEIYDYSDPLKPVHIRDGYQANGKNILESSAILNATEEVLWEKDQKITNELILTSLSIPEEKTDFIGGTYNNYISVNPGENFGMMQIRLKLEQSKKIKLGVNEKYITLYLAVNVYNYDDKDLRIKKCVLAGVDD